MATRTEATIDDLRQVEGKAELVDGEIHHMSPSGGLHGYATVKICASLLAYSEATRSGHAIGDNVGFVVDLPRRKSFSPDVAYTLGPLTADFIQGAPVFAVEIRSKSDHGRAAEKRLAAKRADYFAAGTLVVWDVDLDDDLVVRSYRAEAPDEPSGFRRGELAHAEPALSAWSVPVDDLFPPRQG